MAGHDARMSQDPSDLEQIETLITRLYAAITFEKGDRPPVESLRRLFLDGARLINNNDVAPQIMTVEQFISMYSGRVDQGLIASFRENEICHKTELFGNVAHRFSTYESRFETEARDPFSIGINSIQMLKIGKEWKIAGMVWNDQTPDRTIPERYLKQ